MSSHDAGAVALDCRHVTKRFYYYSHRTTTVREWFIRKVMGKPTHVRGAEFFVDDFSLTVRAGEMVALIGPNGSGKSTVLRLIAGIYAPTKGEIVVNGRVAAVIELGAGFHPDLTGAENVELMAGLMGLTPRESRERYPEIVEFADIGDFLDTPVKYYSSGMQARLAFAVSMCVRPDVALIDEVLAVGDESFRAKCLERLRGFREAGGAILVVSHDLETVLELCQRAVWMEDGVIRRAGGARAVVEAYRKHSTHHDEEEE